MNLAGIFPALTTPFNTEGTLDTKSFCENILRYNRTGLLGYVVNGSTGESVLLRWNEVEEACATVKEVAAPGKLLIAGTAAESTAETIEHTNRAYALGFDAALIRTPHYYKSLMTTEALAEYYLRVADAAKLPILAYSIPPCTGIAIEAPLVERISQHPNIAGIKDSSGSIERVAQFRAVSPERFQIVVGSVSILRDALKRGAVGGILAIACAFPEQCVELREATLGNDEECAMAVQNRMATPSEVILSKYGIPGMKYALDLLGYYGGPARPPLLPLRSEEKQEISRVLSGIRATAAR